MPLASHGFSRVSQLIPSLRGGTTSRAIHIPTGAPTTQTLFAQSRNLLTRFVTHLTAPGLPAPAARAAFSSSGVRAPSIQQRLSLPVRHALRSHPLGAPCVPRAPTMPHPNSVTNVGLGTARNFHAARPLFANIAEAMNVPVAGRALYEMDWEIKGGADSKAMLKYGAQKKQKTFGKEMLKPKTVVEQAPKKVVDEEAAIEQELEHYFPAAANAAEVTTYLLIPLAPTPTARLPLNPSPPTTALLPIPALAAAHASHRAHALHVSALFAHLDTAGVWARGASCAPYGTGSGECTLLRVEFRGWTEGEVRGVIGERGSGWCVLEEVRHDDVDDISDFGGGLSEYAEEEMDPAQSFVLPTLDFSAGSKAESVRSDAGSDLMSVDSSSVSDVDFHSDGDVDMDFRSDSSGVEIDIASDVEMDIASASTTSWSVLSRSASFDEYAPREAVF
ncbi:hypothetical protein PLICRDRAFT_40954 [Plicaturopsis crispa FD-325 SS-3]|nr:hypothetical protein PLICRDRAFT_40954 [Plicaturopsis crispa FD-325 SS-3]